MPCCGGRNGQDLPKEYNKCVKTFHIQIRKPEKTKYKKGEEKIEVENGDRVRETANRIIDCVIDVALRENVTPSIVSEIQESKVNKEKLERSENVTLDLQDEIKKLKQQDLHHANEEIHRLKEANNRNVEKNVTLAEDVKRLEEENRKYAEEKLTLGDEVKRLREEISLNEEENRTLKEDVRRSTEEKRQITEENQEFIEEIERKHAEQTENLKQQHKDEATQLTEEISSLQRNLELEKKAKEDLIAKLKDEQETSRNEINALERDNQIKTDELATLQLQFEQYEAAARKYEAEATQYIENQQRQCQEFKQRNDLLQRQLQQQEAHSRQTIDHLQSSINAEKRAKEDALTRLSAAAASKLRDKNPGITDLSDPNRPLKLSEKISELYDNEWTNAMEHLEDADVKEKEGIEILLNIITILFDHLSVLGDKQLENLSKMIVMPDFDPQMNEENDLKKIPELPIEILKPLKDFRKKHADLAIQRLQKKLTKDVLEDKLEKSYLESCSEYIASCIELVWLMRVQDPPVCIEWNIKTDDDFDTNTMRSYTKSGKYVDFVVWPILYLHKGGPLLCKGVVQGKKMRNVGEEEQLHVQDKENKDKPSEFENFNGEKQFNEGNTQDDSGNQVQRDDTNSNHDPCIPPDINNVSHGDDSEKIQNDEVNVELSPSQEGIMSDPSMSTLGDDSPVIPSASMAAATCEETCVEGRDRSRSSGQSSQGSDSKETYQDAIDDSGSESEQNEDDESFSECKTGDVHDNEGKMDQELD